MSSPQASSFSLDLARTALVLGLCAAAASAGPQHDTPPPAVELASGQVVGEPMGLLPRPTTSFGAVEHGGWLYVMGGYFGRPHNYLVKHQSDDFYRINLHDPAQLQALPNDLRVQSLTLEAHGDTLVRAGGMIVVEDDMGFSDTVSIADCARFDLRTEKWSELPAFPAPRSSHDSVVVGDTLYIVGGWRLGDEESHWYDEVWTLDLADEGAEWQTLPQPFTRRAVGLAYVDGKLVAIGGIAPDRGLSQAVNVLDLETQTWNEGPEYPHTAFGPAAIGIDGRVQVSATEGIVASWKPGESEWQRTGQLVFPRFFHQFIAHPSGGLVAVGGIGREGRVRQMERLRTDGTDAERIVSWKVPYPSGSKNRQGMFLRENSLYLFGGSTIRGGHDFGPEDFTTDAFRLNLSRLEVEDLASFPSSRQTIVASTSSNGKVGIAMGGFGFEGDSTRTYADAYRYDFKGNTWESESFELPRSLAQFGVATHEDRMWLFGGYNVEPDEDLAISTGILREELDGETRSFVETGLEMPTARRGFGSAQLGSKFFVVGGVADGFRAVDACEVFDLESQTWSDFPQPASARISPELVELDGKLYLAGGIAKTEQGFRTDRTVECYDPATRTWTVVLEDLPIEEAGYLNLRTFRGHLLFFSTNAKGHSLAEVALYRPAGGDPVQ